MISADNGPALLNTSAPSVSNSLMPACCSSAIRRNTSGVYGSPVPVRISAASASWSATRSCSVRANTTEATAHAATIASSSGRKAASMNRTRRLSVGRTLAG